MKGTGHWLRSRNSLYWACKKKKIDPIGYLIAVLTIVPHLSFSLESNQNDLNSAQRHEAPGPIPTFAIHGCGCFIIMEIAVCIVSRIQRSVRVGDCRDFIR
mmetsp:Transcript_1518/g.2517  ORF Transcript_1518/g.2517 Transcript_1518/m.2517 type:complete len:101 (+) Transcript_1518:1722-2024(+)